MMTTLIQGFKDYYDDLVSVLQDIADVMPSSPAKRGPLSKRIDWTFLGDGLSDTMGYIRAQMSMPELQGAGGGSTTNNMTLNAYYPPNAPFDLERQVELMELKKRDNR